MEHDELPPLVRRCPIWVSPEVLGMFAGMLPSTFRIVGSLGSGAYSPAVCLILESEHIEADAAELTAICRVEGPSLSMTIETKRSVA